MTALPMLVHEVANRFSQLPQVTAIALGGSRAATAGDDRSDFDLYIFSHEGIPPAVRREIALHSSAAPEIDNPWFGPEDAWRDEATGTKFDLVYWSLAWLEDQIDRVLVRFQASVGYSTCFWYTVRNAQPLFDPDGWFTRLRARADRPYPDALRQAIITLNLPLLRQSQSSFLGQIALAQARGDLVSVHHRVTAFLASYFDILFAINRLPHPGEKRLLATAARDCPLLPADMAHDVHQMILGVTRSETSDAVVTTGHRLTDGVETLLRRQGLLV